MAVCCRFIFDIVALDKFLSEYVGFPAGTTQYLPPLSAFGTVGPSVAATELQHM